MPHDHDENPATTDDPPPAAPQQETPGQQEGPGDSGGARLCAYSGCRTPLPPSSGPGNKPRYCQDGKTWGSKAVSCKQAGHAEELLASIGDPELPPTPALGELGERIGAALGPARELVATLERVGTQLDSEVAEARRERDEALREAAEQRGQRQLADARTAEAEREAAESTRAAEAAAAERDEARAEADRAAEQQRAAEEQRRAAEDARVSAEARCEELRQQVDAVEGRLLRATERAEQAEQQAASASSESATLRAQLEDERARHETTRQRSEEQAARLRGEHAEALDRARDEHAAEVRRLREEWERERRAETDRHAEQIAELNRQLGARDHELAAARDRADAADGRLDHYRTALDGLVRDPDASSDEILDRLRDLLQDAQP